MNHPRQALPRVLLLAAAALTSACSDDSVSSEGEVMVVVTTDMAVPTDFDTLRWSVTPSGASEPSRQGTVELESNLDFPATLAISAGPKTTGPVTIRFEGRKNSEGSRVRVSREATLEFPTEGTIALPIPLTWLCSDGSLEEPCQEGQTCQAGVCIDTGVTTSALPPYAPTDDRACTDVTTCFDVFVELAPPSTDPTTGDCIIEGRIGEDADVNVALTVDNDRVGNYGFCGPFNECHILLPRENSPEGWQATTSSEGIPRIKLPRAICNSAAESIFQVQLLKPSATCPIFEHNAPLCPPPEDTCLEAEICPSSWPEAWKSYACTGAAVPAKLNEEILGCFTPPVEPGEEPTPANGRWCCTTGEEPSNDPLLIDDMSGGPQVKLEPPPGHAAGVWWTSLGEGSGQLWPAPRPALYTYRTFDPPITPTNGPEIKAAACLSSPGFLGYVAMQGLYFSEKIGTYGPVPKDVSEFTGISFWGWAPAPVSDAPLSIEVEFPNHDTKWGDKTSNCWTPEDGSKACDNFQKDVALTDQWTEHFVRWDELHQSFDEWQPPQYRPPGGFDRTTVDSVIFTVLGASPDIKSQPFEFCVAHITFTR